MREFRDELALLCLQKGVSLYELQDVVSSMAEAPLCKRDKGRLEYICTLGGYDYFLGEYFKGGVSWYEASRYAESLGSGWEVPSREVLEQMYLKKEVLGIEGGEWLWSSEEYSASDAWLQAFSNGSQYHTIKPHSPTTSVRLVLKIKSEGI